MNDSFTGEKPQLIYDEIIDKYVLLVGLTIYSNSNRIFLRLYDGNTIYKREVFFKNES